MTRSRTIPSTHASAARVRGHASGVRGFTLIEVLVAMAVFAIVAAITWASLAQVARTRTELAARQDRFAAAVRAVGMLERDLRQAIARPVRGGYGEVLPALLGAGDRIELSRLGFADPRREASSHVERVVYAVDARALQRGRYAVLDRAPGSSAERGELADGIETLRLRYLGDDGAWRETWPPRRESPIDALPRAIEFRLAFEDLGELRRLVMLPSVPPARAAGAQVAGQDPGAETPPGTVPIGAPVGPAPGTATGPVP